MEVQFHLIVHATIMLVSMLIFGEMLRAQAVLMKKELELAVATIMQERTARFDKSFDTVRDLIAAYPPEELADRLVFDIPSTVPCDVVADMFNILFWSTSDNGSAIRRSAERWLVEANDIRKIRIALGLDFYPFKKSDEMQRVLTMVACRFPEVAEQCKATIVSRLRSPE